MSLFKDLGRWYWSWLGFLSGPAVGAIAIYLWLRGIAVQDWVFLLLIVALALGEVYIFSYIRRSEKKGESLAKMPGAPKPTKEILYVLEALAGRNCEYIVRGNLLVWYEQYFKGQEADEFTAVIGTMHGSELIHFYAYDSEKLAITNKGSAYYLAHKERPKKAKK